MRRRSAGNGRACSSERDLEQAALATVGGRELNPDGLPVRRQARAGSATGGAPAPLHWR